MDQLIKDEIMQKAGMYSEYQLWEKAVRNLHHHLHMAQDDTRKSWLEDLCYFRGKMATWELKCAYELGLKHGKEGKDTEKTGTP